MASEIHLGDIGTRFIFTIKDEDDAVMDISSASIIRLVMVDPDNNKKTKTMGLLNSGTDGKAYYTIASGDLDAVGKWRQQVVVEISSSKYFSNIETFMVEPNL